MNDSLVDKIISLSKNYIKLYLLKCLKLQKHLNVENCYVTCDSKKDGAGSQVQAILSTILFAKDMGIEYVHTPLSSIEHNYANDPTWSIRWENFFGFRKKFKLIDQVKNENIKLEHISNPLWIKKKRNTVFVVKHCHSYADLFPANYQKVMINLKKLINIRPEHIKEVRNTVSYNFCLHIRRGDVSEEKYPLRYTHNDDIKKVLNEVVREMSFLNIPFNIHLFSQGKIEDFCDFKDFQINYHLNKDEFFTLSSLISSDILLLAKSSFSYCAGLYTDGIVVYEKFWHNPLPKWIKINDDYKFDASLFRRRLKAHLKEKKMVDADA